MNSFKEWLIAFSCAVLVVVAILFMIIAFSIAPEVFVIPVAIIIFILAILTR